MKHANLRMFTLVLKKFEYFKAQVKPSILHTLVHTYIFPLLVLMLERDLVCMYVYARKYVQ